MCTEFQWMRVVDIKEINLTEVNRFTNVNYVAYETVFLDSFMILQNQLSGDVIRNISCVMLGNFPADTFLKRYFTYEMTVSASHPSVTVAYSVFIFLDFFIVVAANWMGIIRLKQNS